MIGLVDLDWLSSSSTQLLPNLEIMKLATYYRIEENKFCRLLDLKEQDFQSYEKIFVYSEIGDIQSIPDVFLKQKNIEYGGTIFTNGVYEPFDNSIIDYTIPKPYIYKEALKEKYRDGVPTKVIAHFLDDSYYRCYAEDEFLPIPPIKNNKRVFLYDKDFFYPNWKEILTEITSRAPSSIIRVHPIICKKISQYFEMRNFSKLARSNEIILDFDIPYEEIDYMLKKYKNLFLADVMKTSNIFITLGGNLKTNMQYFNDIIYKLNLLFSFWSRNIPIKIKYINPSIGFSNPLENLEKRIEIWTRGRRTGTINSVITQKKPTVQMGERDFLLKYYPSAAELFEQKYEDVASMGRWRL